MYSVVFTKGSFGLCFGESPFTNGLSEPLACESRGRGRVRGRWPLDIFPFSKALVLLAGIIEGLLLRVGDETIVEGSWVDKGPGRGFAIAEAAGTERKVVAVAINEMVVA